MLNVVLLLSLGVLVSSLNETLSVKDGSIHGVCGEGACQYFSIDFGEDTGGENRFKAPVPRKPWAGVQDCTKFRVGCVSNHHNPDTAPTQSEDCLNLNVYAPASAQPGDKLPVMMWLYGGSFAEGFSYGAFGLYDGAYIASTHNVVVVAPNYRLGAFGFLVLDEKNPEHSNFGIADQRLAMKWIHDNVDVFGGNPDSITLFGESAGAMSIGIHLVSPLSKGLFHAAILESNPLGLLYETNKMAIVYGKSFCKEIGCGHSGSGLVCDMECARKVNTSVVLQGWKTSAGSTLNYILANHGHYLDGILDYKPTIDGITLAGQVVDELDAGHIHPVPVLVGTNTDEAAAFLLNNKNQTIPMTAYNIAMDVVFGLHGPKVARRYKDTAGPDKDGYLALSATFTDYWFRCPSEHFANAAVKAGAPAFVYRYNHLFSVPSLWGAFGLPNACGHLVCHAAELPLVFHHSEIITPKVNASFTPGELAFSETMTEMWTNFAKTNNPSTSNVAWPKWTEEGRPNLVLQEHFETEDSVELCKNFWDPIGYHHDI